MTSCLSYLWLAEQDSFFRVVRERKQREMKASDTRKQATSLLEWLYYNRCAIVILLVIVLELNLLPRVYSMGFFCNDPKISFKFTGDTVSMGILIAGSVVLPLIVMGAVEYTCPVECYESASNCSRNRRIWRWYYHYSVGIIALTLICSVIKQVIAEPRPHFLDTCKPHEASNCTDEYIRFYTCTNTETSQWYIKDASKSFPSGHSALSIYTSIFLVWYLQNRLSKRTLLLKPWLQCFSAMWTVICSMTRVADNRHHWWDVLAGCSIGFVFGLFVVVISCQHFRLERLGTTHTLNEYLDNGQIGGNAKQSVKKLLSPVVVEVSENREMKNIETTRTK
ncbi:phospholipid phosphatase 1-like isoform X2 [Pseudomyrmex gracilis]|uniref:phospholipid phosphatase 1-like isoform X2 n=1 Tax=Pseudomyrmex gracilis TaxID=219809 RepID=UPI000995187C|nr:phospholipid phosphatase 1-like isoform X2 [Pseudomyrmex gracilis]